MQFEFILATSKWLCGSVLDVHPSNVTSSEMIANKEYSSLTIQKSVGGTPDFTAGTVLKLIHLETNLKPCPV
jgi:hypothetical protein